MGGAFHYKKEEVKMTSHRWKTHNGNKKQFTFASKWSQLRIQEKKFEVNVGEREIAWIMNL